MENTRGWLVVAVAFLANGVTFGITYSFGVMFDGLSAEFGAGRGATASVFSYAMALHFLLGVVTGPASDRYGPRALLLVGAAVMSAGLCLTSMAPTLWMASVAYGVGTGVGTACTYVPTISAVAGSFERRRSIALGIAIAGVGVGTLAVTPLAARLVSGHGVRTTCLVLGLATAVIVPATAMVAHRPPRSARPAPPALVVQAPSFVRLYVSAAGFTVGVFVPMVFLAPFAGQHEMSALKAASLVGIVGGANAAARVILGAMAARWEALALYRSCFLMLGLGLVVWLLGQERYEYLVGVAVLLGAAHGGWTALLPAVTAQLYGTTGLGRVLGTLHTGGGLGCLVGPPLAGAVIDRTDGYGAAIVLSATIVFGSWSLLRPPEARLTRGEAGEPGRGGRPAWTRIRAVLCTGLGAFAAERQLRRVIRELELLDDHRLRDLGLTRGTIEQAVRFGRPSERDVHSGSGDSDHAAAA